MKVEKTISGALHRIPNLEHNNRDHWPPNATHDREYRNKIFINGTKGCTLEETYNKLFETSYQEWRAREIKKGRGGRCPDTYYEKIKQDKKKHLLYEIIWQIGDIADTGYEAALLDAERAEKVLFDFVKHILKEVPNVTYLTPERLNNPAWEPPFNEGIIIQNFVFNGDEATPHLHMSFIPYIRNCSRGQKVQTGFAQAFKRMGYSTISEQAMDMCDGLVWQNGPQGEVPQMKRTKHGGIDWIEEQKNWIADRMQSLYQWDRFYKGKNSRGDLMLSDYRRERAAERAKEAEKEFKEKEEKLEEAGMEVLSSECMIDMLEQSISERNEALDSMEEQVNKKGKEIQNIDARITSGNQSLAEIQENYRILKDKADIAGKLYEKYAYKSSERERQATDELIHLRYENTKKDKEIRTLKQKLENVYEFMKSIIVDKETVYSKFTRAMRNKSQRIKSR